MIWTMAYEISAPEGNQARDGERRSVINMRVFWRIVVPIVMPNVLRNVATKRRKRVVDARI